MAAEGELADDQGGEVAEEVGHGDEAAADDAGCDLGDTVGLCVVSVAMYRCGVKGCWIVSLRPHRDGEQIVSLVVTSGAGNARDQVHDA